jgi:nitrate reductase delta subunit
MFKLASLLLHYPDDEVVRGKEEIGEAVDQLGRSMAAQAILRFYIWWSGMTLIELQEHYVHTFDQQPASSLYLTFLLRGDTRDRGRLLVELKRRYADAGLLLEPIELPDYLPVMLEFAAFAPRGEGIELLREYRLPIEATRKVLRSAESPYADLLDAIVSVLPRMTSPQSKQLERVLELGPPEELVGLEPYPIAEAGGPIR